MAQTQPTSPEFIDPSLLLAVLDAYKKGVSGTWKDLTDTVNGMAANLTTQVRGLAAIARAGGRVLVQSPDSAEAPSMPTAARAALPNAEVLPLERIGPRLAELAGGD